MRFRVPEWGRGYYQLHPGLGAALAIMICGAFAALDRRAVVAPTSQSGSSS